MSPQQKASGGGSRKSGKGAGQKDSTVAAEQSNNQNSTTNKKHNNASSNVNNTNIDQSKTEKEKPHIKVSNSYIFQVYCLLSLVVHTDRQQQHVILLQ